MIRLFRVNQICKTPKIAFPYLVLVGGIFFWEIAHALPSGDSSSLFPEVSKIPDPAQKNICIARREKLASQLGDGILLIDAGAPLLHSRYYPSDHFYWLTGISTPRAVFALIAKGGKLEKEILFLPRKNRQYELWHGKRLAPGAEATELSGIKDTRPLDQLEKVLPQLIKDTEKMYSSGDYVQGLLKKMECISDSPRRLLVPIQVIKDEDEIAAMKEAVRITQRSLADGIRLAVPGAYEFTVEAEIESGFRKRGAEQLAFHSICGSGPNTCCLHYFSNTRQLKDGDLLLMDVGAKFHHYCADISRTIPVNGKFTRRQREIYTLVYEASLKAEKALRPGVSLSQIHQIVVDHYKENFREEKIGTYFPHTVGHGIGLQVHDAPYPHQLLKPGMVVAIEPGLYLPEEEIGVRIENNYLITKDGAELLSKDIPTQPDELEKFLAQVRKKS